MRRYRVDLDPAAIADLDGIRAFVAEAAGKAISDKLIDRVLGYIDGLDTPVGHRAQARRRSG